MIEFDAKTHTYTIDDVIIPSVSELVRFALGNEYPNVPQEILNRAAERGTMIHNAIEAFIGLVGAKKSFKCEQIVTYQGRYAGTYDLLEHIRLVHTKSKSSEDVYTLIDIKTNAVYPKEHLEWQMGFYKMALEDMGTNVNYCECLWLPKNKEPDLRNVEVKAKEECLQKLEEYENSIEKFY